MATKLASLVVSLEANIGKFDKQLKKADRIMNKTMRNISRSAKLAGAALGGIAVTNVAKNIVGATDAWKRMEGQLKVTTSHLGDYADVEADVIRLAKESRASIDTMATLYGRTALATKDAGLATKDLNSLVGVLAQSFILSGASAQEAAGATRQMTQALSSGVLRGQEYNSVVEQAPVILNLLKDALGVTTGELREMAKSGQLVNEVTLPALIAGAEKVQRALGLMPLTVQNATTHLNNMYKILINRSDDAVGAVNTLRDSIYWLADNLSLVVTSGLNVAKVLASLYIGKKIAGILVTLAAHAATAAVNIRKFGKALVIVKAVMGGLPGIIIALGSAIFLFRDNMKDALDKTIALYTDLEGKIIANAYTWRWWGAQVMISMRDVWDATKSWSELFTRAVRKVNQLRLDSFDASLEETKNELDAAKTKLSELAVQMNGLDSPSQKLTANFLLQAGVVAKATKDYDELKGSAFDLRQAQLDLNSEWTAGTTSATDLATSLEAAREAAAGAAGGIETAGESAKEATSEFVDLALALEDEIVYLIEVNALGQEAADRNREMREALENLVGAEREHIKALIEQKQYLEGMRDATQEVNDLVENSSELFGDMTDDVEEATKVFADFGGVIKDEVITAIDALIYDNDWNLEDFAKRFVRDMTKAFTDAVVECIFGEDFFQKMICPNGGSWLGKIFGKTVSEGVGIAADAAAGAASSAGSAVAGYFAGGAAGSTAAISAEFGVSMTEATIMAGEQAGTAGAAAGAEAGAATANGFSAGMAAAAPAIVAVGAFLAYSSVKGLHDANRAQRTAVRDQYKQLLTEGMVAPAREVQNELGQIAVETTAVQGLAYARIGELGVAAYQALTESATAHGIAMYHVKDGFVQLTGAVDKFDQATKAVNETRIEEIQLMNRLKDKWDDGRDSTDAARLAMADYQKITRAVATATLPQLAAAAVRNLGIAVTESEVLEEIMADGVVTAAEAAKVGIDQMGTVSAEAFSGLTEEVEKNIDSLRDDKTAAENLATALAAIPDTSSTHTTRYVTEGDPKEQAGQRATGTYGAYYTIPSGYNNDTYSMGLSSGEKIKVLTAGESENEGGDAGMVAEIRALRFDVRALAKKIVEPIVSATYDAGPDPVVVPV